MNIIIRKYSDNDLSAMTDIWNEVVEDGIAFPQDSPLDLESAATFFNEQTYCGVAEDIDTGNVLGLYILHPNNVGRCSHLCNCSYAVSSKSRGHHIGRKLVEDSLKVAKDNSFRTMQFNAVVASNIYARKLYKDLGFIELGTVPSGFLLKSGEYSDIVLYYKTLVL